MVKTTLFVNNHLGGYKEVERICQEQKLSLGGTLFSVTDEIKPRLSYAVSPVEAGFDYTASLFNKFDDVIFLKEHDNAVVKFMQLELEKIRYRKKKDINEHLFKILDQNKINFFGCSHTAGIGHSNQSTMYVDVLSELLKSEYNNFGLPGKGNYTIEDLLNTYNIKNSKLVIQFTDMYRIRYMENKLIENTKSYDIKWNTSNNPILNEENLFYNFKQLVTRITNRLREGNNKFVTTHTANIENEYSIQCTEFLYGFKEFASNIGTGVDKAEDNAHYGPKSHKLWAERLYDKWIELYGN
jgi:hypothetical protein